MPSRKIKEIFSIALEALESRRAELTSKIALVQQALGSNTPSVTSSSTSRHKRILSAAARKRIAEAQRKRWQLARQKNAATGVKKGAVPRTRAKKKS